MAAQPTKGNIAMLARLMFTETSAMSATAATHQANKTNERWNPPRMLRPTNAATPTTTKSGENQYSIP
jgi:hypothetical protein